MVLAVTSAHPHRQGERYTYVDLGEASVGGRFEVTLTHLTAALDRDEALTEESFAEAQDAAYRLMEQTLTLTVGDTVFRPTIEGHSFLDTGFDSFVQLSFDMGVAQPLPETVLITHLPVFEAAAIQNGVQIPAFFIVGSNAIAGMDENEARHAYIFGAQEESYVLDTQGTPLAQVLQEFLRFGVLHMLNGHDHIALLFALLLPVGLMRSSGGAAGLRGAVAPPLVTVSVFAMGHLVAQLVAAFGDLELPFRFGEAVVAGALIALAVANVLVPRTRDIHLFALLLGVLHGLSFVIFMNAYGLEAAFVTPSIVAFNLGFWLTQMLCVAVGAGLLGQVGGMRLYRPLVLWAGSGFAGLVGIYWFIERAFGLELSIRALFS